MTRRGITAAEQHTRAVDAGRRMVSRHERPGYLLEPRPDGSWAVSGLPGVSVVAPGRRAAMDALRVAIAEVLDVDPQAFDMQT